MLLGWIIPVTDGAVVLCMYLKKGKGMVLYSAVSSPLDRSKRFTLLFGRIHYKVHTYLCSLKSFKHITKCKNMPVSMVFIRPLSITDGTWKAISGNISSHIFFKLLSSHISISLQS